MRNNWLPFYYPPEAGAGGGKPGDVAAIGDSGRPLGETGDVAILAEGESGDSGEGEENNEEEATGDEHAEAEGEEQAEEGEEGTTEEGEGEAEPNVVDGRPSLRTITAKYPKIFKEFPALKDAYFRAGAYSEIFPSVEEAREAQEKSEILDGFEATIVAKGSSLELLNSIKDTSPAQLAKFVDNLLPTLYDFDSKLFYRATEPVTRQLLWSAFNHANKTGDKNLAASCQHLSNYLFEDSDVKKPNLRNSQQEESPERAELNRERAEFEAGKRKEFSGELHSRAGKQLEKIIHDGLDPKKTLTDFLRDSITDKVIDEVGRRLEADSRHMARMGTLYNRAAKAGYPKAMTDQIMTAYLSAAKALVPAVRNEIKQRALHGKVVRRDVGNRQVASSGNGSRNLSKNVSPKQVDWSKTSDEDFLNDRVVLKK